ncbi:3-oxoacyl-[acyl-carrier-protein] synthase III C-terminal domain-containing protein [Brevundimonas sp. UBA7664]|uniref:3-oxoacyl-[acyl-carrier-protein] synthase III C-terminal domain-containing protein n=1 Tax=Brevundimonas sp. UBA7664 TaxID=1946141 RepID=UPI0025BD9CB8|nr:3-oxoacyl-[acyl-carrier-protein] synthase III C-terminal domain-containing protein [Brevundimonas sp. UBA7664]
MKQIRPPLRDVYITGVGAHLPGPPVGNERMEDHIGRVHGRASVLGRRALRWNGIQTRHYAMEPGGTVTDTNAGMTAKAVVAALDEAGLAVDDVQHLATATTQGDYLVPGHATAVHAALGAGPLEIASYQSVCAASLMAAKGAWLQVRAAEADVAVAAAGEFSSRWFRPGFYEGTALVDSKGRLATEADFLRFTLSDGAGAVVLEPRPRGQGLSLKIDWIDLTSLAGRFDPCMWAGSTRGDRADLASAWSHAGPIAAHAAGAVALLQDFDLLKTVIRAWIGVWLDKVDSGRIVPDQVDHLLCHYSARSLREEIVRLLENTAAMIPEEKWFTTLPATGNIGSASIWVMLEAFMRSGRPKKGDRVLLIVPESGRAMIGFMMLEVV